MWTFEEEEALLSEMDVTGQAFEDMQEQNSRLMQQLREKDDANFKLMSERIKSNQIYKLLREEKEELADQVLTFKTQVRFSRWTKAFIKSKLKSLSFYEAENLDVKVIYTFCFRNTDVAFTAVPRWTRSCWLCRS